MYMNVFPHLCATEDKTVITRDSQKTQSREAGKTRRRTLWHKATDGVNIY